MALVWNKHRFSGGALVFDLVNTVVYRRDPVRLEDRLGDGPRATQFANAALVFRREDVCLYLGSRAVGNGENALLLELREAAYACFRPLTEGARAGHQDLAKLLRLISTALDASLSMPFATDVALSALHYINPRRHLHVKACPNCHWLFLDKSKNSSRIWCDMAVCGNRQKARRSYLKRTNKPISEAART
jgi:predicted RNA-binding Zn ribbon-like protein